MATFDPPDEFNAEALARSADRALKVLLPWCQLPNSYVSFTPQFAIFIEASYRSELPFARDVAAQARAFVEAIDFSVVAAQNGLTVAEEDMSDLIPIGTPDQLQSCLEGMLDFAKNGYDDANTTLQMFRGVRHNVLAVCRLFFCCPLVLTCSGQLLREVEPGHEEVESKFSIYVNGPSMSISLHLYRYTHSLQWPRRRKLGHYAVNFEPILTLKNSPII